MIEPFEFVLIFLAAYRITRFLTKDTLMGFSGESGSRISLRLDSFAYNEDGTDRSWLRGKIGDLLTCSFCLGFWVSLAVLCVWIEKAPWALDAHGVLIAFSVAGAQGYMSSRINA